MSKNEYFKKYFVDIERILEEYLLTHGIENIMTWRNILPCVYG
jgi:hypothetical protein